MNNQDKLNKVLSEMDEYKKKGEPIPVLLVEEMARGFTQHTLAAKTEFLNLAEVVKKGTADMKEHNEKLIQQKILAEGAYLLAWEFIKQRGLLDKFKRYLASYSEPHPEVKASKWQAAIGLFLPKKTLT